MNVKSKSFRAYALGAVGFFTLMFDIIDLGKWFSGVFSKDIDWTPFFQMLGGCIATVLIMSLFFDFCIWVKKKFDAIKKVNEFPKDVLWAIDFVLNSKSYDFNDSIYSEVSKILKMLAIKHKDQTATYQCIMNFREAFYAGDASRKLIVIEKLFNDKTLQEKYNLENLLEN